MGKPRRSSSTSDNVVANTQSSPTTRPRSRSRTIIRMLTTKLSPRTSSQRPPAPPAPPPAPPPPATYAKEQREAALRERGLLPPLRPNKDLSRQELEQDARLPPVPLPENDETSAADLVKREWEAKNRDKEEEARERMSNFRFGRSSSNLVELDDDGDDSEPSSTAAPIPPHLVALPPSPLLDTSFSSPSSSLTPTPTPTPTPANHPEPEPPVDSTPNISTPDSPTTTTSPVPVIALTPAIVSSSSSPGQTDNDDDLAHARSDSLAKSSTVSTGTTPSLSTSAASAPSTTTPGPTTPTIPHSVPTPTPTSPTTTNGNGTGGLAKGKAGLLTVRTVEAKVPVIIESPVDDSFALGLNLGLNLNLGLSLGLGVEDSALPLVVEEPETVLPSDLEPEVDENPKSPECVSPPLKNTHADDDDKVDKQEDKDDKDEEGKVPERASPNERPKSSKGTVLSLPFNRKRGVTDPTTLTSTTTVDRKKTLNVFRRGHTISQHPPSENKSDSGALPLPSSPPPPSLAPSSTPTRASSSAFSAMRRSVVGSLARPRSIFSSAPSHTSNNGDKHFDASHLPPSPSFPPSPSPSPSPAPSRFKSMMRERSLSPPPTSPRSPKYQQTRRAVSPVVYSRGSILAEAAGIEDEETRMRTEMAFLG